MKKHILSKKCWCKPEVESYKWIEKIDRNKIFQIVNELPLGADLSFMFRTLLDKQDELIDHITVLEKEVRHLKDNLRGGRT